MWPIRLHMNVVPKNIVDKIEFFTTHLAKWEENASAMGSDPATVAAMAELTAAAREAYKAQQILQDQARSATLRLKIAMDEMAQAGAAIILQVRAKAGQEGNGIYTLASISPPDKRSPIGKPGTPEQFAVKLQSVGSLILTWKCKNPRGSKGTMYHIRRQDTPNGEYKYLGVTGIKRYVDVTVPAGVPRIVYQVQAYRSNTVGPIADYSVSFGGVPKEFQTRIQGARAA